MYARTMWRLPGVPTLPDHSANKLYVDQNAPGATPVAYATTITPDLSNGKTYQRTTLTGAMTVAVATGGVDTMRWILEATASGGQQVLTFAAGYLLGNFVTTRTVTIPSGATALIYLIQIGSNQRLASVDPGG